MFGMHFNGTSNAAVYAVLKPEKNPYTPTKWKRGKNGAFFLMPSGELNKFW